VEVSGKLHAPAALSPGKPPPTTSPVNIEQVDGTQSSSEPRGEQKKNPFIAPVIKE